MIKNKTEAHIAAVGNRSTDMVLLCLFFSSVQHPSDVMKHWRTFGKHPLLRDSAAIGGHKSDREEYLMVWGGK